MKILILLQWSYSSKWRFFFPSFWMITHAFWCPVVTTSLAIYRAHTTQKFTCPIKRSDHIRSTYTMRAPNLKSMHGVPTYLPYLNILSCKKNLGYEVIHLLCWHILGVGVVWFHVVSTCTSQIVALLFASNHESLVCFLAMKLHSNISFTTFKLSQVSYNIIWN